MTIIVYFVVVIFAIILINNAIGRIEKSNEESRDEILRSISDLESKIDTLHSDVSLLDKEENSWDV